MSLAAPSWPDQQGRLAAAGGARPMHGVWRRYRRVLWWSPVALIVLAAAIFTLMAAAYQPLQPLGEGGCSFYGLRTGAGIRWVSQYIVNGPELYVPPQRGSFALGGSIANRGSFAVTILGVRQSAGSPFTAAGPARYLSYAEWSHGYLAHAPRHLLRDVTLAPGQGIMIGMPLRIAYCADRRSYVGEDVFLVTERFLGFTHTVAIPFFEYGRPVITNAPGDRAGPAGTFCSG